jgi:hypothetical protein
VLSSIELVSKLVKEDEIGRECNKHGVENECMQGFSELKRPAARFRCMWGNDIDRSQRNRME